MSYHRPPRPTGTTEEPANPDTRDVERLKFGAELQVALAQSLNGVMLRGARRVPVGLVGGGTRPATSPADAFVGLALTNTSTTSSCTVTFYDGKDTSGDYVMEVTLAPGESTREWFGLSGIALIRGLVFSDPAGQVRGSVFLRGSDI